MSTDRQEVTLFSIYLVFAHNKLRAHTMHLKI